MPLPQLALALALAAGPAPLTGCGAHDRNALKTDSKEYDELAAATKLFWDSVRWGDTERAAVVFEEAPRAARWEIAADEMLGARRFTDVSLVEIDMHPRDPDAKGDVVRTASVTVRTEGYELPAQILRKELWTQTWYRSHDGWHLSWEGGPPLTPDPGI
ncbi:MAG: hypothetical protein H6742_18490 [Alphaproteobacteria bacterium]|nr:hypothetical protein [Alphaproteobacteria bacterium]